MIIIINITKIIIIFRETKKRVTVCCTHLKAKKGFEGVRLAQARHLLDIIKVMIIMTKTTIKIIIFIIIITIRRRKGSEQSLLVTSMLD